MKRMDARLLSGFMVFGFLMAGCSKVPNCATPEQNPDPGFGRAVYFNATANFLPAPEGPGRTASCGEIEAELRQGLIDAMSRSVGVRDTGNAGAAGSDCTGALPEREWPVATAQADRSDRYTGTNNQEEGVDEGDQLKNDGKYLYVLRDSAVEVIRAWPVEQAGPLYRAELGGEGDSLHLDPVSKRLAVFVRGRPGTPEGRVRVYEVQEAEGQEALRFLREFVIPGDYYQSTARVGSVIRGVVPGRIAFPAEARFGVGSVDEIPATKSANEKLIREMRMDLCSSPDSTIRWSTNAGLVGWFGLSRVFALDLKRLTLEWVAAPGYANAVYHSTRALTLARTDYGAAVSRTLLQRFAGAGPHVENWGEVEGTLLNSFALDEEADQLRVATTGGARWGESVNRIQILSLSSGTEMKLIGKSPDLGLGERIYAVRFQGQRGYVVTFRVVDPVYILDLTDPTQPQVLGELKVPGYSTYLQLIEGERLLAIGRQEPDLKFSLFDARDPALPSELHTHLIPRAWSSADWNHHHFNYFDRLGLLAVPVSGAEETLQLFRVDGVAGFSRLLTVALAPADFQCPGMPPGMVAMCARSSSYLGSRFIGSHLYVVDQKRVTVVDAETARVVRVIER